MGSTLNTLKNKAFDGYAAIDFLAKEREEYLQTWHRLVDAYTNLKKELNENLDPLLMHADEWRMYHHLDEIGKHVEPMGFRTTIIEPSPKPAFLHGDNIKMWRAYLVRLDAHESELRQENEALKKKVRTVNGHFTKIQDLCDAQSNDERAPHDPPSEIQDWLMVSQ